jgi:hypothetical protein
LIRPGTTRRPRRLNDFKIVFGCEARADGCDPVVFDEDVGDRRMMDVAIMVIDLPAPDQQFIGARHSAGPISWSSPL